MSSPDPVIHVFNKGDYSQHRLVTLPPQPPSQLPPSSIRIRTRLLGQTTNNLTYANLGFALGWWSIYPPPPHTPPPYNDAEKYASVPGWGYADVLESSLPDLVPAGSCVYGYIPVGTLPADVQIADAGFPNQLLVTSPHRQHLWTIYNRLTLVPRRDFAALEQATPSAATELALDALMQVLFGTAYNLNRYGFAWDPAVRVHPAGVTDASSSSPPWTAADADLSAAFVFILNAAGKTGLSFAYCLRSARPAAHQPGAVIGVGSARSSGVLADSGFFDAVLRYEDAQQAARELVEKARPARVVVLDFGARKGGMQAFVDAVSVVQGVRVSAVHVGGEVRPAGPGELMERLKARGGGRVQVNANVLREKGIEVAGGAYFEEFAQAWKGFVEKGGVPGMQVKWGTGMEDWEKGWDAFCKDEVPAGEGRVYRI